MQVHRVLLLLPCLPATLAGQQLINLHCGPGAVGGMVFDSARGRAVEFSPLGEVFEYVGGQRLHRANLAPTGPSPRQFPALVYDSVRRHVLLFGGQDLTLLDDTWSWDGLGWTQLGGTRPPGRMMAGTTFDTVRGVAVMFGGFAASSTYGDTWEHDGTQWQQRAPMGLSPSGLPALAFDASRGVTVMVLASGQTGTPMPTYEWDGIAWLQRPTPVGPPVRQGSTLAYDPARRRTVCVGGGTVAQGSQVLRPGEQVWEWDGATWTLAATLPIALRRHVSAWYDAAANGIVVAGGAETTGDATEIELATWNGTMLAPGPRFEVPSLRSSPGFAAARDGSLMFGGSTFTGPLDGTWTWTGHEWRKEHPTVAPSPRTEVAMCRSAIRDETLLFGGSTDGVFGGQSFGDFWSWNGTNWSSLPSGPPARYGAGMTEDLLRNEIVLFGGANGMVGTNSLRNDTWTFDGLTWTQRQTATAPSPRMVPAMAFDLVGGGTLLFGGRVGLSGTARLNDSWRWDGLQWQQLQTASQPPALAARLEFEFNRGRVQLAGSVSISPLWSIELWEFDGLDWLLRSQTTSTAQIGDMARCATTGTMVCYDGTSVREWTQQPAAVLAFGASCGAPPPRLAMRSRPRAGTANSGLELQGRPGLPVLFAFDAATTSLPLGNGCTALVGGGATFAIGATDGLGIATMLAAVPTDVAFRLTPLFAQGAVLDPTQPGGFAVSGGLRVQIGH